MICFLLSGLVLFCFRNNKFETSVFNAFQFQVSNQVFACFQMLQTLRALDFTCLDPFSSSNPPTH